MGPVFHRLYIWLPAFELYDLVIALANKVCPSGIYTPRLFYPRLPGWDLYKTHKFVGWDLCDLRDLYPFSLWDL